MPRHDGSSRERTRKQRKRRGRNGQRWADLTGRSVETKRCCRITMSLEAYLAHVEAFHPHWLREEQG